MNEQQCYECARQDECGCLDCQGVLLRDTCLLSKCTFEDEDLCPYFDGSEIFEGILK